MTTFALHSSPRYIFSMGYSMRVLLTYISAGKARLQNILQDYAHNFDCLTLIGPGEVKVDLADFDLKLQVTY